jgi:hypothetical protein
LRARAAPNDVDDICQAFFERVLPQDYRIPNAAAWYIAFPHDKHECFICGLGVMMDAIEKVLSELGVRRFSADRLVIATGTIVILMSMLFALVRVSG